MEFYAVKNEDNKYFIDFGYKKDKVVAVFSTVPRLFEAEESADKFRKEVDGLGEKVKVVKVKLEEVG